MIATACLSTEDTGTKKFLLATWFFGTPRSEPIPFRFPTKISDTRVMDAQIFLVALIVGSITGWLAVRSFRGLA